VALATSWRRLFVPALAKIDLRWSLTVVLLGGEMLGQRQHNRADGCSGAAR
jgi:hypothetical protein